MSRLQYTQAMTRILNMFEWVEEYSKTHKCCTCLNAGWQVVDPKSDSFFSHGTHEEGKVNFNVATPFRCYCQATHSFVFLGWANDKTKYGGAYIYMSDCDMYAPNLVKEK